MSAVPSFAGTEATSEGGTGTAQLLGPPSSNSELHLESPAMIPPTSGAPPCTVLAPVHRLIAASAVPLRQRTKAAQQKSAGRFREGIAKSPCLLGEDFIVRVSGCSAGFLASPHKTN